MDTRKLLVGLIAGAICLISIFAGTAFALPPQPNTFHAELAPGKGSISEGTPAQIRGVGVGTQEFHFSYFKFNCESAKAKNGIASENSSTFYAQVRFGHCETYFKLEGGNLLGPYMVRISPIDFEFHQNHYAEFGGESESEVRLLNGGSVEARIGSTRCEVEWEPQTIPAKAVSKPEWEFSSVEYANEEVPSTKIKLYPSGFQKVLYVASALKNIKTYAGGGRCENFRREETGNGYYKGTLMFSVTKGNLEYAEP